MWKDGDISLIALSFPGYPQAGPGVPPMKIAFAVFALLIALGSPAFAQVPPPADTKAISDCLKKAEDAGQLGTNCIGTIADPCIEKSDKTSAKTKVCATRELSVWTALSDAASKRVRAGGFKEISTALAESEKGWLQLRDKLCPAFDRIEPGFLQGDSTYCRMQTTAHRTLLLRRLGDAVNEH
jgi:lysozyme inhibitor LprI